MTQIDAVSRVLTFIEANLQAPLDVATMAEVASYSLYYFCRLFGKVTRHTPHDYLIRRRMTRAAPAVTGSQQKIIEIAFDYQFESHEGFTRAFGRMFGLTPSEARQQGSVPPLCCLPPLTRPHLLSLQTHNYLVPEIIPALPSEYRNPARSLPAVDLPSPPYLVLPEGRWLRLTLPLSRPETKREAGGYARFILATGTADLPLVLDWLLHTWLFYAPYRLAAAHLLLEQGDDGRCLLYVPVAKA